MKNRKHIHLKIKMCTKMLYLLLLVTLASVRGDISHDPVADQIILYGKRTNGSITIMTTSAGAPVEQEEATRTLNQRLMFHENFMDRMTHFDRERIPERVVHAKAGGAFGYFEVTHDITDVCNADLFNKVGKRTPIAARFSPVIVERGGIDTSRDARGFAIKFYTNDGNLDIAGLNFPIFAIKDPLLFPSFIRAQKKNPATNVFDANTLWDFVTHHPETLHFSLFVYGDGGIPDGYRHMPGFSIHTFQVVNKNGKSYFVKFHFLTNQGIKYLTSKKAMKIAGCDPDYATRDLYRAIGNGDFPSWNVSVQVLSESDVKNAGFDVFDVTRVWPLLKYPLRPVGVIVLDRNPVNYFADIEQLAYCPSNLVTNVLGGVDKLFEGRRFSYRDTQHHRLGSNFFNIRVNYPINSHVATYNRDGDPPVGHNHKDAPNYHPNSFGGPDSYKAKHKVKLVEIHEEQPDNFDQAHELYENGMTPGERSRLVENIVESLSKAAKFLQDRAVNLYTQIHADLGQRIWLGLPLNNTRMPCYCDD